MLITRRRWDFYFVPLIVLTTVSGLVLAVIFEEARCLVAPLAPLFLWLFLRWMTPVGGFRSQTISATPGMPQFLAWSSIILGIMISFFVLDEFLLGHKLDEPPKLYHYAFTASLLALLFLGVWRIEKRYKTAGTKGQM